MTNVTEKQFLNQFAGGEEIDINDLSEGTRTVLENKGLLSELTDIAGEDGKIKGSKELTKLYKVVDRFDTNGSSKSFEKTVSGGAPTTSAVINDALVHDFNRNVTRARMNGPQSTENQSSPSQAKVKQNGNLKTEFDFGRPITQEQAAKVIFKDGKVPDGSKLVQGPGNNSWTVKSFDSNAQQAMTQNIRPHTERSDPNNPGEYTFNWSPDAQKVNTVPNQKDQQNEYGFKISKSYKLDAGQHWGVGTGYELNFDKPMTKAQVMETLYPNTKLDKGDVKLIPDGKEPAKTWQVQVTTGGFVKMNPDIGAIFSDATANVKESIRPDMPTGIRTHLENHTIPDNAVAHPKGKSHPPGAYVWEEDGHMVYVLTDGKGKEGMYDAQVLKLNSGKDSQFNKDMRYYMKENGMPPKMAVTAYNQQWEELNRMMITGFAMALSSASPGSKNPAAGFEQFEKDMMVNWRAAGKGARNQGTHPTPHVPSSQTRPVTDIGNADTMPAMKQTVDSAPPPHKQPTDIGNADTQPGGVSQPTIPNVRKADPGQEIKIKTPQGSEQMTVGEYRRRWKEADQWVREEANKLNQRKNVPPPGELYKQAQEKFGLNDGWQFIGNPLIYGPL